MISELQNSNGIASRTIISEQQPISKKAHFLKSVREDMHYVPFVQEQDACMCLQALYHTKVYLLSLSDNKHIPPFCEKNIVKFSMFGHPKTHLNNLG